MQDLSEPDDFVFRQSCPGNIWAESHYTEDAKLFDSFLDVVRKSRVFELFQGSLLCRSLRGGTDSDMGRLLISRVREEYAEHIIETFSIISSPKVTVLGIVQHHSFPFHQHVENRTSTCCWSTRSCTHNIRRLAQIRVRFDFWVHGIHLIPISCIALCWTTLTIELHLEFCVSHKCF